MGRSQAFLRYRIADCLALLRESLFVLTHRERSRTFKQLGFVLLALVSAKLLIALVPLLLKELIDRLASAEPIAAILIGLVVGYAFSRVLSVVFGELRDILFVRVSQSLVRGISIAVIAKRWSLPLWDQQKWPIGISRLAIERGVRGLETVVTLAIFSAVPSIFEFTLVSVLVGLLIDFRFSLILGVSAIIYLVTTISLVSRFDHVHREMNDSESGLTLHLQDTLENIEALKSFQTEKRELVRMIEMRASHEALAFRSQSGIAIIHSSQTLIVSVTACTLFLLAIFDSKPGVATAGVLVLLSMYLVQMYDPLSFFSYSYRNMRSALIDLEGIQAILSEKNDREENFTLAKHVSAPTLLKLTDIDFQYSAGQFALRKFSLELQNSTLVAIVGSNGAGKSTLTRLIANIYQPQSGTTSYCSRLLAREGIPLSAFASSVPRLFSGSIKFNIAYGRVSATDEEVVAAAKLACADEFIRRLPDGYETVLDRGAAILSSGEAQRISLARALLMSAPLLVLDEATSALDMRTEKELMLNIRNLQSKSIAIFSTHRLSTAQLADEVVVLSAGKLVGQGPHVELVEQNLHYRSLWGAQKRQS